MGKESKTSVADILGKSKLFAGISKSQLKLVAPLGLPMSVNKGKYVFTQGQEAKYLYIVSKGRLALQSSLQRPDGSVTHTTTVASIGPGGAFGWPSVIEPHVYNLLSYAVEDSELVMIPGAELSRVLDAHSDLGYRLMQNVALLLASRLDDIRESFVYERDWLFEEKGKRNRSKK